MRSNEVQGAGARRTLPRDGPRLDADWRQSIPRKLIRCKTCKFVEQDPCSDSLAAWPLLACSCLQRILVFCISASHQTLGLGEKCKVALTGSAGFPSPGLTAIEVAGNQGNAAMKLLLEGTVLFKGTLAFKVPRILGDKSKDR